MKNDLQKKLKLQELENLASVDGFEFTEQKKVPWFPYTSNMIGPYYVQSMKVLDSVGSNSSAINSMVDYIRDVLNKEFEFFVISSGETRDWPFGFPISTILGTGIRMLYKDGSYFGIKNIEGINILHIADLNNEGSSIRKWNEMIKKDGGRITDALFYVDRMEDGVKVLEELGIKRHAIIDLDEESWKYLLNNEFISQSMYQELVKYWKEPLKWGCEKILTDPGPLYTLIKNEKKRERGIGIFELYNKETNGELASVLGVNDIEHFLTKVSTLSVKEIEELVTKSSTKK